MLSMSHARLLFYQLAQIRSTVCRIKGGEYCFWFKVLVRIVLGRGPWVGEIGAQAHSPVETAEVDFILIQHFLHLLPMHLRRRVNLHILMLVVIYEIGLLDFVKVPLQMQSLGSIFGVSKFDNVLHIHVVFFGVPSTILLYYRLFELLLLGLTHLLPKLNIDSVGPFRIVLLRFDGVPFQNRPL